MISSLTLKLTQKDVEYLIDDNTNPDPKEFALHSEVSDILSQFKGSIFAKFSNRSAKDCSVLDRKVVSVEGLILLVKMSEYLTEALGEN